MLVFLLIGEPLSIPNAVATVMAPLWMGDGEVLGLANTFLISEHSSLTCPANAWKGHVNGGWLAGGTSSVE